MAVLLKSLHTTLTVEKMSTFIRKLQIQILEE